MILIVIGDAVGRVSCDWRKGIHSPPEDHRVFCKCPMVVLVSTRGLTLVGCCLSRQEGLYHRPPLPREVFKELTSKKFRGFVGVSSGFQAMEGLFCKWKKHHQHRIWLAWGAGSGSVGFGSWSWPFFYELLAYCVQYSCFICCSTTPW